MAGGKIRRWRVLLYGSDILRTPHEGKPRGPAQPSEGRISDETKRADNQSAGSDVCGG